MPMQLISTIAAIWGDGPGSSSSPADTATTLTERSPCMALSPSAPITFVTDLASALPNPEELRASLSPSSVASDDKLFTAKLTGRLASEDRPRPPWRFRTCASSRRAAPGAATRCCSSRACAAPAPPKETDAAWPSMSRMEASSTDSAAAMSLANCVLRAATCLLAALEMLRLSTHMVTCLAAPRRPDGAGAHGACHAAEAVVEAVAVEKQAASDAMPAM
mmetsp:Transcript_66303/g.188102  ORF Transcript_66303/g.188102 Transcript_66303/m.188102 type:complete len:220 (+) Transcript_66303:485-1144(+)